MSGFELGDWVEITCFDGAEFSGMLMHVHPDYIVLNGYGYARASIKEARHGQL